MLTYPLSKESGRSLYEQLYEGIRRDILSGTLPAHQRLPSKRALAQHLEVSIITVQNAYEQLAAEGYIYSQEKRGYYVSPVERPLQAAARQPAPLPPEPEQKTYFLDLVTNSIDRAYFPFTVWARLMRETLLERDKALLQAAPYNGAEELRRAISDYLRQFRGMNVDSGQIIVGAGTEFLYSLLIQLLGREKCYAVEDPGYSKIAEIYRSHQVNLRQVGLDEKGLSTRLLRRQEADIVHLSPSHHYPTGIVMPIGRRQELLRWAEEQEGRWILEDDYDSEFRFVGRPIPTLFSIDEAQRVIYLNTFSKTIAPSIRISYMILPPRLMEVYREKLGFYACTVSGFEQYTLAKFMAQGRYEQHLSRMKARYRQKRDAVIAMLRSSPLADRVEIMEQDAGLHFLVRLDTRLPDAVLRSRAAEQGVRLALLSDYYSVRSSAPRQKGTSKENPWRGSAGHPPHSGHHRVAGADRGHRRHAGTDDLGLRRRRAGLRAGKQARHHHRLRVRHHGQHHRQALQRRFDPLQEPVQLLCRHLPRREEDRPRHLRPEHPVRLSRAGQHDVRQLHP